MPKIISFAWTTEPLLSGRKTRTRRKWSDKYANRFKVGDVCYAYDRQPRFKGKKVAEIKITSIKKEDISLATKEDYQAFEPESPHLLRVGMNGAFAKQTESFIYN